MRPPAFEEKLVNVVGLYADPPVQAVMFCVDEKTQGAALDRLQLSLPLTPGAGRRHDIDQASWGLARAVGPPAAA